MTEAPTHPPRWLKFMAGVARWALGLMLAFWLLLALAWGGLHWWIVPRIDDFRPLLQRQAQRALGVVVRVDALAARSEGVFPALELSGVALFDAQGREALRLPRVSVTLSPRSVLRLGVEQLYIAQPELDVRRDASGRFFVAGLPLDGQAGDASAADWLLSQTEVAIRGGTLRWTDELRGTPTLELGAVDVVLRGGPWNHALRLDATPPAGWGGRLSLRARLHEPLWNPLRSAWQHWSGQWYVELPGVDLARWAPYADLGEARVSAGQGTLRAWVDMEAGQVSGAVADVALQDVRAAFARALEPLALRDVAARVGARRLADGLELSARGLRFVTDDGLAWDSAALLLRREGEGARRRHVLEADRLDLALLARIAGRVPLAGEVRQLLATYTPQGRVEQLRAQWQGGLDAPARYEARGRVADLDLAGSPAPGAQPRAFGLRGARGSFELTQAGGSAALTISEGDLLLPGVFEDPRVPVQTLSAHVRWQVDGARIAVQSDDLRFANADAQGQARLRWSTGEAPGARLPGVLDLSGSLTRADGTRVHRYLPLAIDADARHYVRDAITAGRSADVRFRVRGDLRRLPFDADPQGEFHIAAQVKNATFAYVPPSLLAKGEKPWPALVGLSGALVFDRASMRVEGAAGSVAGSARLKVVQVSARIADLDKPVVQVEGEVRGPLADMLAFVRGSQVSQLTDGALDAMDATGDAATRLQLRLPIAALDKSSVQGSVALAGNEVRVAPALPVLAQARGAVQFTERGFTLQQVRARALGGEVQLAGGLQAPPGAAAPVLRVQAQGTASGEGLRAAAAAGPLAQLARRLDGSSAYALTLGLRDGRPELLVTSDLQGMALDLPAPLAKSAGQPLPVRLQTRLVPAAPGAAPQERLEFTAGELLSAVYLRDAAGARPAVLAGRVAIGVGADRQAPPPAHGVEATVALDAFDADAWKRLLDAAPAAAGASAPPSDYLPERVALRVGRLTLQGRTLHDVVADGARQGSAWRGSVAAQELSGRVEYHPGDKAAPQGRVYARLSRLSLPQAAGSQVDALLDAGGPSELPALDVQVQEFELRGRPLGRLDLQASNRTGSDGLREWRLTRFDLETSEATLSSSGNWALLGGQGANAQRRTVLRFALRMRDSGELLARMGMPGVLRKGEGTLEGQVGWLGSPLAPDYHSMTGQMKLDMSAGQFLKADPGLSKLLGVLSLQALPRRFALDFRDVFSKGFAFDFVRADVHIDKGIASTNNLQMKGVNAAVLMEGSADIARETQDLHVVVVPELNTLTASLVATAINPVIGLGSFLAQIFLHGPLVEAATQEFRIEGTWDDPQVHRIARGAAAAPAPAGETP